MSKATENDVMNSEELSLEQAFAKIDELMREMSEEDIPLEKTFDLYKQGMELLNFCNLKIDKVEKQIKELSDDIR